WAKKATHAKVRFAIHEGESTISVKQEFESQEEFRVGMRIRIEGQMAKIRDINLFGGKSVKTAYAMEISRITCVYDKKRRE
ncbi:MAG: HVO_0476 family zinc finger protein, partial [SAR202 cluster bacterium]|nr:HVO_0476 family zinc finger protein [SAR202 cluster bacterium]